MVMHKILFLIRKILGSLPFRTEFTNGSCTRQSDVQWFCNRKVPIFTSIAYSHVSLTNNIFSFFSESWILKVETTQK